MEGTAVNIPRLRGVHKMIDAQPLAIPSKKEIEVMMCSELCTSDWTYPAWIYTFDTHSSRLKKKYIGKDGVNWTKLHGKMRKILKYAIKKETAKHLEQKRVWDKYVGKPIIHFRARIGGGNWEYYGGKDLEKQPWFVEKVDDAYDSTFCDIYARGLHL